jgi:hypothetical protein
MTLETHALAWGQLQTRDGVKPLNGILTPF